ncbi:MAG: alkyl sulfatase dimerization domain-containing protein [Moritella sp.]|uniref:alkyl/aryl-sulfatase n=1 Tax=Moritella sp. TaxID=78556 RepID=UPI0029BC6762|nr:alkyl sulfatase dimerization domain-containing protein [Moritella sp.]MDX2320478.1 alkyl sulfatase dimerization domain-containing protein [Moritella sp.]
MFNKKNLRVVIQKKYNLNKVLPLVVIASGSLLLVACGPKNDDVFPSSGPDKYGFTAASEHTIKLNKSVLTELPFEDKQDFTDANRGFIATLPEFVVKYKDGTTIMDLSEYNFVNGDAPGSVNPSLWRQAKLNNINGLFKVTDGVYQVRGFDLANMTVIEGKKGWIIVDPLTTSETAKKALDFVNQELGYRPVSTIVFTHSHMDHFGGVSGLLEAAGNDVADIEVVAPGGFMEEATNENIIAGPAMSKRASYMYGNLLPRSERGHVDAGLGKAVPFGTFSILEPTLTVHNDETQIIDGVEFEFQIVSGTEAPSEFTFYLPKFKAYCGAEMVSKTMHNLYTLRGAQVRDAVAWSRSIDEAIDNQKEATVYFGSHHWPVWGQENIHDFLVSQRDTYQYIHDQSVRMLNAGLTPKEIAEEIVMPPKLANTFSSRGYYGTAKHNAKAIYQKYLGWYNANPVTLDPLPEYQTASKYVKLMGGADAVIANAKAAYDKGEYRWSAELLNHVVFADADNGDAKEWLARSYDQLGYQAESAPWRDVYLSGAYELRHGAAKEVIDLASMKVILLKTPVEKFFESMAARIIGPDAFGKEFKLNINFTDLGNNYVLTLDNAVLRHKLAPKDSGANATLNISHELFIDLVIGVAGVSEVLLSDDLSIEGSKLGLVRFFSLLDKPEGVFNIVTP